MVVSVNAGFKAKRRLANLGIVPGAKIIKKKSAPLRGPLEITVKGSSLVIGRGLAAKIIVSCNKECEF
ncbi:MAG: ferrous iron transport protein A [Promethearchaeota archaeon]